MLKLKREAKCTWVQKKTPVNTSNERRDMYRKSKDLI